MAGGVITGAHGSELSVPRWQVRSGLGSLLAPQVGQVCFASCSACRSGLVSLRALQAGQIWVRSRLAGRSGRFGARVRSGLLQMEQQGVGQVGWQYGASAKSDLREG